MSEDTMSEGAGPPESEPAIRVVMMPRDTNAAGTIFGGVILSHLDLAAAIEAHKHHQGMVVTVAMNQVEFKQPVHVGDLVSFFTETVKVGRTSVQTRVCVWAQRRFGDGGHIPVTEAHVTMVAVDSDGHPTPLAD